MQLDQFTSYGIFDKKNLNKIWMEQNEIWNKKI
jgi:hypothetical protein